MTKAIYLITACAMTAALSSCGGGGGGSSGPAPISPPAEQPATVRDGSVTGNYTLGNAPRFMLMRIGLDSFGVTASANVEAGSGAVTRINSTSLSGTTTDIQDIAGTTHWTIGRWFKGVITDSNGSTQTLAGDNNSLHYFLGNSLAALPTSGTYTCGGFRSTDPSFTGGAAGAANYGRGTSGTATLSFSASGAALSTNLTVEIGSGSTVAGNTATVASTDAIVFKGDFFSGGDGAAFSLFDAGGGSVQIVQAFKTSHTGARYQGIATWTCTL